jgi:hypothetical protein
MRFRAVDLRPHGWQPPQTLQIPDWCGCSTELSAGANAQRLVADGADLGARANAEPATALGARRPLLGGGYIILTSTGATAEDIP